jgi:hypothetical protein
VIHAYPAVFSPVVVALFAVVIVGCASSSAQEESKTEVSGTFVFDGDDLDREYTDEEIDQFARAYIEVMAIQQRYYLPISQAPSPEESQALIEESEARSQEVIYEHGLTMQEFNAIMVRMPSDDELRGRVHAAIQRQEAERLQELQEAQDDL